MSQTTGCFSLLVILKHFSQLLFCILSEFVWKQPEVNQLEVHNKLLTEQLAETKSTRETLTKTLEETKNQCKVFWRWLQAVILSQSGQSNSFKNVISLHQQDLLVKLEEKETELNSEKKNALKRDKTIQGLTQVLKEKEKEVSIYTLANLDLYIGQNS